MKRSQKLACDLISKLQSEHVWNCDTKDDANPIDLICDGIVEAIETREKEIFAGITKFLKRTEGK